MNNYDNCNSPLNNHKPACLDKINQIEKFLKELKNYINSDTDITANSNFTIHETTPKTTSILNTIISSTSSNTINKHTDDTTTITSNNNTNTKFYLPSESVELWDNFARDDLLCFYAFENSPLLLCHLIQEMFHICHKLIQNIIKDKYRIMSYTFNLEANNEHNIKIIEDTSRSLFRCNLESNFFNNEQKIVFYSHFIKEYKCFFYNNLNMQFDKDDKSQQFEELIKEADFKTCVMHVQKIILFCEFNSPQLKIIDIDIEYPHRKLEVATIMKHNTATKNDSTLGSIHNNSINNNNSTITNSIPLQDLLIPYQPDIKSIDNVLIVIKPPVMFKNNLKYSSKYKTIAIINNNTSSNNNNNIPCKNSLSACNTITNHASFNSCIGLKQLSNPNLCGNINTHSNKSSFVFSNGVKQTRQSTHVLTKHSSPSMVLPQSPILTSKSPSNNNDDGSYQGCITENNGDGCNTVSSKWKYSHTKHERKYGANQFTIYAQKHIGGLNKNCFSEYASVAKRLDLDNVDCGDYTGKNQRTGVKKCYNNKRITKNYISSTARGSVNNRNKSSKETIKVTNRCNNKNNCNFPNYHHRPKENIIRMIKQQSKQTLTQATTKPLVGAQSNHNYNYNNTTTNNNNNINKTRTNSNNKVVMYSNSTYQYPRNRKKPSLHEDKLNSIAINNKDFICLQSTSNSKPKSKRETIGNFGMNTKTQTNQFELCKMLQQGQTSKSGMVQIDKNRGSIRSSTTNSGGTREINVNNICNNNDNSKKVSIVQGTKEKNTSMCNSDQRAVTDYKYE